MHSFLKKMAVSLATLSLLSTCTVLSPSVRVAQAASTTANTTANIPLQLVCDDATVDPGGMVGYHILYHNVQNKAVENVMVHIKVPEGFDIDTTQLTGADWDDSTRMLTWHLQNVEKDGARVIHFQLKVDGQVKTDSDLDLTCSLDEDGSLDIDLPDCSIHTGTEVDQPFFVGYPDGNFHPGASITRAEAAAVVARIKQLNNTTAHPYTDVSSNFWAYKYINEVSNAGLMVGYDDGSFHPNDPITRAELVQLVMEMRGLQPIPIGGFDDDHGHWAQNDIDTAKALGFVNGVGDNDFLPNAPTQRQVAAELFDVALFRGPLTDGDIQVVQHYPDVPRSSWSYGWVEEASKVAHESKHVAIGAEYLIRYLPDQTQPM